MLRRCRNRALAAMILSTVLKCRYSVLLSRDIVGRFRSAPRSRSNADGSAAASPFAGVLLLVASRPGMVLCGRAQKGIAPPRRGKGRLEHDLKMLAPNLVWCGTVSGFP